ncbi:hypothetical protein [Prevotella sp. OH937_COT-195]|uniref:hypothetical protein n=1 Tax=Prevotella sp. OH937_COT-195 TaxID=2491051 RepID=UPI000F64BF68|nr:hypothetical protein [Prevotella sp. OH937_COT-195]RRC97487.1 hypothetical protein EII32_10310 [Prevotella sp. OH937_COT-195]
MTNKRKLKKAINKICNDLFAECIAYSLYNGKHDNENVDTILASIININSDFVKRISHPEPGMKPKSYYKKILNDFDKSIYEVIDNICNLG